MTATPRLPRARSTGPGSRLAGPLLCAALLLSGCTSGSSNGTDGPATAGSSTTTSPSYQSYVALGDSFSSGPLIPTTDLAGGCARSDSNYPSLLADELGVEDFTDVTCSGATTRDLGDVQRPFGDIRIPPQLRAVDRRTDLVTLGIGGNDLGLFATLVGTCTRLRASDPDGSPCARRLSRGPEPEAVTATIGSRVTASLRAVRRIAPGATVVLVGYPRLVPEAGTCSALPLAAGDYAVGRRISGALDRALAGAARRAGATYVDVYDVSRGHDICSADPWVNGRTTDRQRALAYHPFASGMRAVADQVLATLARSQAR
ncbi:MAG TPA: SGNH/GDSL hydrolase family protein [Nocardioidaceae bacterium]|nr:SGNH/GDSL hydrolase family protein [Nocardioidaceae bacterium]